MNDVSQQQFKTQNVAVQLYKYNSIVFQAWKYCEGLLPSQTS